jgi:signal transduction histidine kinase
MDIKVVVTRAGIFVIVYTLVLGIPFWLGYITKSWFSATGLAVVLATLGPFIYTSLRKRAEDLLLKDQRRYQKALREAAKSMTRNRDLDKLAQAIDLIVVEEVKVSFAAIYLKDEEYNSFKRRHYFPPQEKDRFLEFIPLEANLIKILYEHKRPLTSEELGHQDKIDLDSGLVIPCFMEDELLGFMVLGPKPNNQIYTQDDLVVFETLSYSTSLAIENSQFWREIEEHQRQARIQEMDLFSYSLAHEIDNPMNNIKTVARYLKDYLLKELNLSPEKQKEVESVADSILGSQERVSGMVKAIEEFGKPTTGEFGPLKLEDVLKNYFDLYLPEFKYHGIFFTKEVPEKIPYIRGVKQELMQILANFSNNSIHALLATKEKKIHLKIEVPNSDFIRIIFKDNGYGITEEKLRSIFAPFVTTKASTEGKGMGLYTIRRIIERHKGRVWVESEGKGKGATFYIELPIAKDVTEEDFKKEDKGKRLF